MFNVTCRGTQTAYVIRILSYANISKIPVHGGQSKQDSELLLLLTSGAIEATVQKETHLKYDQVIAD